MSHIARTSEVQRARSVHVGQVSKLGSHVNMLRSELVQSASDGHEHTLIGWFVATCCDAFQKVSKRPAPASNAKSSCSFAQLDPCLSASS